MCVCAKSLRSCPPLCNLLGYNPCQVPLSMGFSRQEYWSGLRRPSPGDLPDPGIEPTSPVSPASAGGFIITGATWDLVKGSYFISILEMRKLILRWFKLSVLSNSKASAVSPASGYTSAYAAPYQVFCSLLVSVFCFRNNIISPKRKTFHHFMTYQLDILFFFYTCLFFVYIHTYLKELWL